MSKNIKKAIIISITIVLIIIAIIATFFIVKYFKNKALIDNVCELYSDDNVQENIENPDVTKDDITMQIDGETILGVIKIDQIEYEGLVSEGTSLATLKNYVGHFDNTPYLNGNVCLAAHNTNKFWAKLHTLKTGDKITYISFLGTKNYYVTKVMTIDETDWSLLEDTDENMLTLITCVKGQKSNRLCVQAMEF